MPDQPYLYSAVESQHNSLAYPNTDFNPKAVTQAHYAAFQQRAEQQKRKAAQDGRPLINFNRHPDSYMIVANPTVHHEPLPAYTKKAIIVIRWVQFVFRLFQEIGALGLLVCVICLKMASDGPGWIIRVAPAWDVVISTYALYHLLRPAKGRTPSSSGSYHFFALFMDTGLVPFYVFIALYAQQNLVQLPEDENRWTSFFSTNFATTTVIQVTFIGSIAVGALHLVSCGLDLYLILMFRKIARMPPDMNPLEENLTGSNLSPRRRSQKHKYKSSEMTVSSVSTDSLASKKEAYYSVSPTYGNDSRHSLVKEPEARVVPWSHSRMNSENTYSAHNPNSARLSRQQFDSRSQDAISLHQGPRSARSSRVDVHGEGHRSRAGTVVSPIEQGSVPEVIDFGNIPPLPAHSEKGSGQPRTTQYNLEQPLVKSQQKNALLNDNWFAVDADVSDLGAPRGDGRRAHPREPTLPKVDLTRTDSFEPQRVQPLGMNPPTPNGPSPKHQWTHKQENKENYEPIETGVARQLTVASHTTVASSVYSESAPSLMTSMTGRPNNGTPVRKQYGDLAAAQRAVRGTKNTPKAGRVISRTGADITDMNTYDNQSRRREVSGKIAEEGRGGWTGERYYAQRSKSIRERKSAGNGSYGETEHGPVIGWAAIY